MVRIPLVADMPISVVELAAPAALTIGPEAPRSIIAVSDDPGAPAADQLLPVAQSLSVAPIHVFVAAATGAAINNKLITNPVAASLWIRGQPIDI
jgi:hypothetical protein